MTIEYEFEIKRNDSNNDTYLFKYIERNYKLSVKIGDCTNKRIFVSSSISDLLKIASKVFKKKDRYISYIIKRDNTNDILDVLYDIDVQYFNTDNVSEKESKLLKIIYNNVETH